MSISNIILQEIFLYPLLKSYMRSLKIEGLEHLKELQGPAIFVSNHNSHADTALILYVLPFHLKRNLFIAAAKDYFYKNAFVGFLCDAVLNTFAFDRNNIRNGLGAARDILNSGASLLIYPEGSRDQRKKSFKRGFALLAKKYDLPVVPIFVEGTNEMLPKGQRKLHHADLRIVFAKPIYADNDSEKELASKVENQILSQKAAA